MSEIPVTSRDNPVFKRLLKLADSSRARREARMSLLDGEHLLTAYLDAGGEPHTLVRAASCDAVRFDRLAGRCRQARSLVLPDRLFAELSPVATPTGILAEAAWLEPPAVADRALVIALEDIQDPGNLGSMLRTGAAAGATLAVLSKGCTDAWSPKALRGGQGAQFVLPLLLAVDLAAWLASFDGQRIALSLGQGGDFYALDLTPPLAIIVGNEGAGLSQSVCRAASICTQIPMAGRVESLNASAALAVAVFEAARQRRTRTR